jgi:UDP-2-acetamido-3-amino-2,3-dideoxy-glucuronate N-acetyltransferase
MKGVIVGSDCNICDGCFLEAGSIIGNRVTIKTNVSIWSGLQIADDVFIGPNVSFCNDTYPRSRQHKEAERTFLGKGSSIGAGAVILPSLEIGEYAMVGAGSVVTRSVPANATVVGNPARITAKPMLNENQKSH